MNHNQRTLKSFHHYHHHQEEEAEEQEPSITKKLIKWIPNSIKNQFKSSNQYHNLLPNPNHHSSKFNKPSSNQSQSKPIIIILITFLISYNLISWILDQPNHLDLDPIIDPITFQILPTGDPLRTSTKRRTKSSVAIQQENEERQSAYNLRILHAIQRNITKASRELKNKIIPIYDPLEEAHLDRSDPSAPTDARNTSEFMWYKGDEGLRKNRPASRFKCDRISKSSSSSSTLLFIGIFTTPERVSKRNLIRTFLKVDLPGSKNDEQALIDLVFVSGKPKNEYWKYLIEEENKVNGNDIVVLQNVENDNIDVGKSFEYFKWISRGADGRWKDDGQPNEASLDHSRFHRLGRPQFVMKADDDTFLVIPNLIREFQNLSCDSNIYWGTSQGSNPLLPSYFRGLAYALSWPLVEWIGSSSMAYEAQVGIEDARVGAWLTELDPSLDPVLRIDVGWRMGDWNQLEIDEKTIGLHWLKSIEWFPMVKLRVLEAWKKAGKEFRWDWYYKLT